MILVSNDFPPKVGGIQNYLYELWSRLPLSDTRVITTKYPGSKLFDIEQSFEIDRYAKILWPTPGLVHKVNKTAKQIGTDTVLIDPMLPTGLIAPRLHDLQKVLIVHGAEITVPGRMMPSKPLVKKVVDSCDVILSAGNYAAREVVKAVDHPIKLIRIPPGVDTDTFRVPTPDERDHAKYEICRELGIQQDSRLIMSASRIVPRKGFDVAIKAMVDLPRDVNLIIVGMGRDMKRLTELALGLGVKSRVHFLGRVSPQRLLDMYHAADLFLMLCRDRWRSLEAEGFGIVFLEASACGLPVIAGRSGGSDEAVIDSRTGYVVDPLSVDEVRNKIIAILDDPELAKELGEAGRRFVEREHNYNYLAGLLLPIVQGDFSSAKSFEG